MHTFSLKPLAVFGAAALLTLAGMAFATTPARAAGLTSAQINAIISLLSSFGADQSVINNVSVALGGQATAPSSSCVDLSQNLTLGSSGSDVTNLQNYLIAKGDLAAGYNTGYYGFLTAQAVGKLQLNLGILASASDSAYGITGPQTRNAVGCSGSTSSGGPTQPGSPIQINNIAPSSAAVGSTVTITGSGFGSASIVEFEKGIDATPSDISSNSLTFTVPQTAPGTYNVRVIGSSPIWGAAGSSNYVQFTVTSSSNQQVSFTATPGAAPLTVNFSITGAQDNTTYNVNFGDGSAPMQINTTSQLESSGGVLSGISHTYASAGTYNVQLTEGNCSCPANGVCNCPAIIIVGTATVTVTGGNSVAYTPVALSQVINYASTAQNNYVSTQGTVVKVLTSESGDGILLTDNNGGYLLVTIAHAFVGDFNLDKMNPGDSVQVKGIADLTSGSLANSEFGTAITASQIGMIGVINPGDLTQLSNG